MYKIKNPANAPYDIETADGIKRLPALGEITVPLTVEQLSMLEMFDLYEISKVEEKAPARKAKD